LLLWRLVLQLMRVFAAQNLVVYRRKMVVGQGFGERAFAA
jgi:hypothetical protein